jgi:hypothetical protein
MKGLEVMNGLLICGFKSRTPHQSYAVIHNARKEKALGERRKNLQNIQRYTEVLYSLRYVVRYVKIQ